MTTVEFNSEAVERALRNLANGMDDMSDPMAEIAEALLLSTKDRIQEGITPEGVGFAARSQATLDAYAASKPPKNPVGGPLRLTGDMASEIFNASGPDFAEVGSNAVQAAMMHFGGSRATYANLWGDIPARPFIGLSEEDETAITEITEDWLQDLIDG